MACFLACEREAPPWLAGRWLEIRWPDLFHRLRFDRDFGVAVVSSESVSWSVHHPKLKMPLQWHEFQEPANLVIGVLKNTARSGIALPRGAKRLESKCRVHRSASRENRAGPACPAEAHSVWRGRAPPSAVADRVPAYLFQRSFLPAVNAHLVSSDGNACFPSDPDRGLEGLIPF
jgi:hypothetical protein